MRMTPDRSEFNAPDRSRVDSREQAEAWGEKVMAVRTEAGFGDGPPSIEYLEVHRLVQR